MSTEPDTDIEQFIDATSLADAVELLAEICIGKAERLRSADPEMAAAWDRACLALHDLSTQPAIKQVGRP